MPYHPNGHGFFLCVGSENSTSLFRPNTDYAAPRLLPLVPTTTRPFALVQLVQWWGNPESMPPELCNPPDNAWIDFTGADLFAGTLALVRSIYVAMYGKAREPGQDIMFGPSASQTAPS